MNLTSSKIAEDTFSHDVAHISGWTQEDDFSLFVADAYGYIHVLDSDLNLRNQYTIDAQVIGITVDPNSTHDDQTIVYSTMSQTSFDIRKLFVETNKAAKLFDSFGKYITNLSSLGILLIVR